MLLLAGAAALAVPSVVHALPGKPTQCPPANAYVAGAEGRYDGRPLIAPKLTELAPANMYMAVMRVNEEGCLDLIVVRYNVGR